MAGYVLNGWLEKTMNTERNRPRAYSKAEAGFFVNPNIA
jgi:hypothetical protein